MTISMDAVLFSLAVLFLYSVDATNLSTASGVPQMAPCLLFDNSTKSCISSNNCSGGQTTGKCMLSVSPQDILEMPVKDVSGQENKPSPLETWVLGCLSVGIISLSGITGAVLWPLLNSPYYPHVMTALIGLAAGSLSSTALFQLIPEAFELPSIKSGYLTTAFCGWTCIWVLFFVEGASKIVFKKPAEKGSKKRSVPVEFHCGGEDAMQLAERQDYVNNHHDRVSGRTSTKVSAVAWMIIFGDGLHNFIDGVTIGAGYSQAIGTGIGLSLAVACEEFPHELGDFAILLQSGLSLKKAMCYNFLSACTAFLGLILGIVLGNLEGAHYIFSFAGSLFLYIALGHLIPELKGDMKKSLSDSRRKAALIFLLQNIGLLTGAVLIYMITKYNDNITHIF